MTNFWESPDLPLINRAIELDLTWSRYCVISEISRTPEVSRSNPTDATLTTGAIFQINNPKLCVWVVSLSINDNIKFLEKIMQGLKRGIFCNKYRS